MPYPVSRQKGVKESSCAQAAPGLVGHRRLCYEFYVKSGGSFE